MSQSEAPATRGSYREGLGFGVLSFGTLAVLGLLSSVVIARLYGVTVLGEYTLAIAPVNILAVLSSAREQVALVRELATLPPRAPRVAGLFYAVLIFSFGLTAALAVVTGAIVYVLFEGPIHQPALFLPTVAMIAGYTVIQNSCWNVDMVFSAFGAGRELFWTRLNQALAFIALAAVGGYVWRTVWALAAATVTSYLTSLVHKALRLRRYMRLTLTRTELARGMQTLPTLIRFGLKIAPGQIADGVGYELGTFTLAILLPVAAVGAYGRALQLARRFLDLQWKVVEMLFPTLVRRREERDREGFDRALIDSARYSLVGMLLPAAVIGGAATGVMRIFGSGFSQGGDALTVLMLMPALTTMSVLQRGSLIAVERPWTTAISGGIRLGFTIVATIALSEALGATGAALGIVVGTLADLLYTSSMTRRHLHTPVRELWSVRQMIAILAAYGVGFAVARVLYDGWATYAGLIVALAAGTLAYALAFLLSGGMGVRDRARLASIWESMRRRGRVPAARTRSHTTGVDLGHGESLRSRAGDERIRVRVCVTPASAFRARPRLWQALERAYPVHFEVDVTNSAGEPHAILAHGVDVDDALRALPRLQTYSEDSPRARSRVRLTNTQALAPCLRERRLSDASAGIALQPQVGEITLAERDGVPAWVAETGALPRHRAAVLPAELDATETLRDRFKAGRFLALLPLLTFLRTLCEGRDWWQPPLRAAFVFDDPNLHWPSYGYLDFADLAERAGRHSFHVAFATVPLDGWYANRRAVELIRSRQQLSLLLHGNEHAYCELGKLADERTALALAAQAVRRVRALERRTGLTVARVMAPPHGECSEVALGALRRTGLLAACISRPYPWLPRPPADRPLAQWEIADTVAGLPVLPRLSLSSSREELPLRAFLGQPLILYGHHGDLAGGAELLEEIADEVNWLGSVQWCDLATIARGSFLSKREGNLLRVRMYAREADLRVPLGVEQLIIDGPASEGSAQRAEAIPLESSTPFGAISGSTGEAIWVGELHGPVRVRLTWKDEVDVNTVPAPPRKLWPPARRVLTQGRDRLTPALASMRGAE